MARSSDRDFWKRQFETGGNLPFCSFEEFITPLTAADVLDRFKENLRGGEILEAMHSSRNHELKMTRLRCERMNVTK